MGGTILEAPSLFSLELLRKVTSYIDNTANFILCNTAIISLLASKCFISRLILFFFLKYLLKLEALQNVSPDEPLLLLNLVAL